MPQDMTRSRLDELKAHAAQNPQLAASIEEVFRVWSNDEDRELNLERAIRQIERPSILD